MKKNFILFMLAIFPYEMFTADIDYHYPEQLIVYDEVDSSNAIFFEVYPVGWSEDGKFSYISVPPDEARGWNDYWFIIQNMITNKPEFSLLLNENYYQECVSESLTLKDFWEKNSEIIFRELKRHKIVQQHQFKLDSFPTIFKDDTINFRLNTFSNKDDDSENNYLYNITGYELILESKKQGSKIVDKDEVRALFVDVMGYIKSPYENRIAILFTTTYRGWEGPPHPVFLKLIGCDLATDFKK